MAACSRDSVRMLRFGFSGLMATGLHAIVAMTLITKVDVPPTLANVVAFSCATSVSYLTNTLWSFSASIELRNAWRFGAVSVIGLALTALVSASVQMLGGGPLASIAAVICTVPAATFALHRTWTYV